LSGFVVVENFSKKSVEVVEGHSLDHSVIYTFRILIIVRRERQRRDRSDDDMKDHITQRSLINDERKRTHNILTSASGGVVVGAFVGFAWGQQR
jgi:hypothetical protein